MSRHIPKGLKIKKPGTDHHARFMSKSIYYLKISILSPTFKMSVAEKQIVKRMAIFMCVECFTGNTYWKHKSQVEEIAEIQVEEIAETHF